jgi:uncharacterized surface protein with fasciclin (FAS1) repeats
VKQALDHQLFAEVVAADAMSSAIVKMIDNGGGAHPVKTVGGCTFTAKFSADKVMIADENGNVANATIADVDQSIGVNHVIDAVRLPKS